MTSAASERKKLCISIRKTDAGVLREGEWGYGCYTLAYEARNHDNSGLLWWAEGWKWGIKVRIKQAESHLDPMGMWGCRRLHPSALVALVALVGLGSVVFPCVRKHFSCLWYCATDFCLSEIPFSSLSSILNSCSCPQASLHWFWIDLFSLCPVMSKQL